MPWDAIGNFILGLIKERRLEQWIRLFFQILISSLVTFLFTTGTALITSKSWPVSVGLGMLTTAGIIGAFVRRSPITKGMIFTFPAGEAEQEMKQNTETVIR